MSLHAVYPLTNSPSCANSAHSKIAAAWEHRCKKKTERTCLFPYTQSVQTDLHRGTRRDTLPNITRAKISLIGHLRRAGSDRPRELSRVVWLLASICFGLPL